MSFYRSKVRRQVPHTPTNYPLVHGSLPTHHVADKSKSLLLIYSSVLATLATVLSAWVAYKQYELQGVQTKLTTEQIEISRLQTKSQIAQNLPSFQIERRFDSKGKPNNLFACGSKEGILASSGFKVRWLARLGRYTMPATSLAAVKVIDVGIKRGDEVVWHSQLASNTSVCAWTEDISWLPIQRLINKINVPSSKVGYFISIETLITIYPRDASGEVHQKHYLMSSENPEQGELLSESEAAKWINKYLAAIKLGRSTSITNDKTDISAIANFFL